MKNVRFVLAKDKKCAQIVVEDEAYEGVKRIAKKAIADIKMVTDCIPEIKSEPQASQVVLFATIGKSKLLEKLVGDNKLSFLDVEGKREVYGIKLIENPWDGVDRALVIYGSDKRGTIYGIFSLSEWIGVSPLVFWGDAKPQHQEELVIDAQIEKISKEPSVKYRGFFINDEWPCFGKWAFLHYEGFTAKMYDHVFELLLRLKGNLIWPAMWTSSFGLDGPGEENARLADMYGVIVGNSHHEPCLRASEEWDIYKGKDSEYGLEWNYITNKDGLLKYWEDGLKRSGKYESIITVGMRGERDSIMQGTQTLEDNINVLKDIIEKQNELITKCVDTDENKIPRLLAIYKEVEQYFYGDDTTQGLAEWEGLESIILMLCEDNFGNMRALPDKKMLQHNGGYGMYYHLDYHGSPVSYEWVNSTPLSKIWEQMSECYEYGVREVWMVNVGDLKGNEFPLSYFLDLAYDFDKWGTNHIDSPKQYTKYWIRKQFGKNLNERIVDEIEYIITNGILINNLRRPEALNSKVYHPAHYLEADRMLVEVEDLLSKMETIKLDLPKNCKDSFYSMVEQPLQISMNLLQMQLFAGKNEHYAMQGKKIANKYREMVTSKIKSDKIYAERFASFLDGKWKGMELGKHIGFRKWNEDGCRYPIRMEVEAFDRPRLVVSRRDREEIYVKNYGEPETIEIRDFLYPGRDYVELEVANDGIGIIDCQVMGKECSWLSVSWSKKEIMEQSILRIICQKDKMSQDEEKSVLLISDGDTDIRVVVHGKKCDTESLLPMTFYEQDGVVSIHAEHFTETKSVEDAKWTLLEDYGKTRSALKVFPVTKQFKTGEGPSVTYQFYSESAGKATLEVWSAPSNPLIPKGRLRFGLRINDSDVKSYASVGEHYVSGKPEDREWSEGVLNQIHKSNVDIVIVEGINKVELFSEDAGFVLEGIIVYKKGKTLLPSYLGPEESWYAK